MKNDKNTARNSRSAVMVSAFALTIGLLFFSPLPVNAQGAAGTIVPKDGNDVPGITVVPGNELPRGERRPEVDGGPSSRGNEHGPGCRYRKEGELQLLV